MSYVGKEEITDHFTDHAAIFGLRLVLVGGEAEGVPAGLEVWDVSYVNALGLWIDKLLTKYVRQSYHEDSFALCPNDVFILQLI